jgi:hypothetical protein
VGGTEFIIGFEGSKALPAFALKRSSNMLPVRYELGFYIPEDEILDVIF